MQELLNKLLDDFYYAMDSDRDAELLKEFYNKLQNIIEVQNERVFSN
jgi:hypothetical protein